MDYFYLLSKKTALVVCMSLFLFLYSGDCKDTETLEFNKAFTPLFGHANLLHSSDHKTVNLILNQYTGSGFKSSDLFSHGFFSAKIKLPSTYTAGIVVAFYTTNGDIFEKSHDELDFEFLGNIKGKAWRFQTNLYGNGSTSRGREERYNLWFDPSKQFHTYSILWTSQNIIFYIDEIPIREIIRNEAMGGDYPSKPMFLYATIWDASNWATSGGKYKVKYKYAPFIAEFTDLTIHGCNLNPLELVSTTSSCSATNSDFASVTPKQRMAMNKFRQRYMYYSYCYDTSRYSISPPECVVDPLLRQRFKETGRLKFGNQHRSYSKRSRISRGTRYGNQDI